MSISEERQDRDVGRTAMRTGLDASTVRDLYLKGWRYVEKLGEISRWEHPMWKLETRRI